MAGKLQRYALQRGHLSATPEGDTSSRADQYRRAGVPDGLPDLDIEGETYRRLMDDWGGLAWADSNGMGLSPISYLELRAFAECAGDLSAEDVKILRLMSESFVSGYRRGSAPLIRGPVYDRDEDDPGLAARRQATSDAIKAAFAPMIAKSK